MKSRSKSAPPLRFGVVGLAHISQAAVLPAFCHGRPHVAAPVQAESGHG
jgi:predicted dehydrogenase